MKTPTDLPSPRRHLLCLHTKIAARQEVATISKNPLEHLNPSQREAVATLAGPLLVLAGAGTGKTRVITCRMANLIQHGTPADRILSVTFTNKAAKEMRERTEQILGSRLSKKPWISTFHAYCVRVLREEITALGYPGNFTIFDRGDQESAARYALRDVRMADKSLRPGDLLALISKWKTAGVSPQNAGKFAESDADVLAAVAYRRYQNNLRAAAAVDFDDLLLLTNELFQQHPEILARQQQRFDHVQIDEYQDTNGSQFQLVEALVRAHHNLCVVGDDDQSIYGWRGAEVAHILGFQTQFPAAKVVRLEDNYRCTGEILELANQLVRHNKGRHDKKLVPHKSRPESVRFLSFEEDIQEAEGVAREIRALIDSHGVPPGDVCVLFRTNEQPRLLEVEFRRAKVPYVMVGSQSFFDRREIRDLLAYLRVLVQSRDEISLLRIINVPARGIGEATVQKLLARAVKKKCPLWDAVPEAVAEGDIPPKAAAAIDSFRQLLARYRRELKERPITQTADVIERLIAEIDYESEIQKQYKEASQQLARSGMLEEFVDSIREFLRGEDSPSLDRFLEEAVLVDRDTSSEKDKMLAAQGVKLMTLHSAKGLEFPRVYLVGMEEGLLPHRRSVDALDEKSIAEERRLCYVGITRAMNSLTLTRAVARRKWGKLRPSLPSRFLAEMRGEEGAADEFFEDLETPSLK